MLIRLADFLIRFRWAVVGIYFITSLVLLYFASQIGVRFSFKEFFPDQHQEVIRYNKIIEDFGEDDTSIMVAFEGRDVFTVKQIRLLRDFHHAVEEIPGIESVDSMINAPRSRWENDTLYVDELFEEVPQDQKEIEEKRRYLMESELYSGSYVSGDGSAVLLLAAVESELNSAAGRRPILEKLKALISDFKKTSDLKLTVGGVPHSRSMYAELISNDTVFMTVGAALMTLLILLFTFRHWSGVLLSMSVVLLSLLATTGLMAAFGVSLTLLSTITPVVVMITGVSNSVHYHTRYYEELLKGRDKREALRQTTSHLAIACFITSFTTAVGFSVLYTTDIQILREFGLFTGLGVMSAYFTTILFLPAVMYILPTPPKKRLEKYFHGSSRRFLDIIELAATRHKLTALALCLLLGALSAFFAMDVERNQRLLEDLDEDHPVIASQKYLERKMGGVMQLDVLIETGQANGIKEPEVLRFAERVKKHLQTYEPVRKVYSGSDFIKEMAQTINGGDESFYKIPDSRQAIAQYMLLYSMSGRDPMDGLASPTGESTRVSARIDDIYSNEARVVFASMEKWLGENTPQGLKASLSGLSPVAHTINTLVVDEIFYTFILAFFVITVLLIVQFRSVSVGLASLIPNLFPIAALLGAMGLLDIGLKPSSAITFSIAFGIAVDDTVHFITRYLSEHVAGADSDTAASRAIHGTGKAMIYTSLVLICGFSVPIFASDVLGNQHFGILAVIAIAVALMSDLLLVPLILPLILKKNGADAR